MVRLKNRYLLAEILQPTSITTKPHPVFSTNPLSTLLPLPDLPPSLQVHAPLPTHITSRTILENSTASDPAVVRGLRQRPGRLLARHQVLLARDGDADHQMSARGIPARVGGLYAGHGGRGVEGSEGEGEGVGEGGDQGVESEWDDSKV